MAFITVQTDPLSSSVEMLKPYHAYVVVNFDDGSKYFLRAGPEPTEPTKKRSFFDASGNNDKGSWGNIIKSEGVFEEETPDWDEENDDITIIVFTGNSQDIKNKLAKMQNKLQEIHDKKISSYTNIF